MFLHNYYISLTNSKKIKIMEKSYKITKDQVDNLLLLAGNLWGFEEILADAIKDKNVEHVRFVQRNLACAKERLRAIIDDIER